MMKHMKQQLAFCLVIALLLVFSGCDRKSNENDPLPPLSALSEYSEEQLNEILSDYTMFDIHEAWGMPETPENITLHRDIYPIPNCDKLLVIYYDWDDVDIKVSSVIFRSPINS